MGKRSKNEALQREALEQEVSEDEVKEDPLSNKQDIEIADVDKQRKSVEIKRKVPVTKNDEKPNEKAVGVF